MTEAVLEHSPAPAETGRVSLPNRSFLAEPSTILGWSTASGQASQPSVPVASPRTTGSPAPGRSTPLLAGTLARVSPEPRDHAAQLFPVTVQPTRELPPAAPIKGPQPVEPLGESPTIVSTLSISDVEEPIRVETPTQPAPSADSGGELMPGALLIQSQKSPEQPANSAPCSAVKVWQTAQSASPTPSSVAMSRPPEAESLTPLPGAVSRPVLMESSVSTWSAVTFAHTTSAATKPAAKKPGGHGVESALTYLPESVPPSGGRQQGAWAISQTTVSADPKRPGQTLPQGEPAAGQPPSGSPVSPAVPAPAAGIPLAVTVDPLDKDRAGTSVPVPPQSPAAPATLHWSAPSRSVGPVETGSRKSDRTTLPGDAEPPAGAAGVLTDIGTSSHASQLWQPQHWNEVPTGLGSHNSSADGNSARLANPVLSGQTSPANRENATPVAPPVYLRQESSAGPTRNPENISNASPLRLTSDPENLSHTSLVSFAADAKNARQGSPASLTATPPEPTRLSRPDNDSVLASSSWAPPPVPQQFATIAENLPQHSLVAAPSVSQTQRSVDQGDAGSALLQPVPRAAGDLAAPATQTVESPSPVTGPEPRAGAMAPPEGQVLAFAGTLIPIAGNDPQAEAPPAPVKRQQEGPPHAGHDHSPMSIAGSPSDGDVVPPISDMKPAVNYRDGKSDRPAFFRSQPQSILGEGKSAEAPHDTAAPVTDEKPFPQLAAAVPVGKQGRDVSSASVEAAPAPDRSSQAGKPELPQATSSSRDIRLELNSGDRRVEVRVAERGGEVHVAVRTPDSRLAGALRDDLPALSSRLEQTGLRTESWHTPSLRSASHLEGEPSTNGSPGDPGGQSAPDPREQPGGRDRRQPENMEDQPHRKEKGKAFAWFMSSLQ